MNNAQRLWHQLTDVQQEVDSEAGQVIAVGKHDKALDLLAENHIDFDPESAEAKRLLRKIDLRIMPMVFTVYLLQLMDKNSLSFAAIMGIRYVHLSPPVRILLCLPSIVLVLTKISAGRIRI
jgi:hypothetical protein